jgi:hypothetical protein
MQTLKAALPSIGFKIAGLLPFSPVGPQPQTGVLRLIFGHNLVHYKGP